MTTLSSGAAVAGPTGAGSTATKPREMQRLSKRERASRRQNSASGDRPTQLPLLLVIPPESKPKVLPAGSSKRLPAIDRFAAMDARMSTSDVVRVVGVNRSTLFRWCKKGQFPPKHVSGGWLRSDVEKWFTAKAIQGS